jgi:hypothetical protein
MRFAVVAVLTASLFFPLRAGAQVTSPLSVGSETIQFPTEAGYLSVRDNAPGVFKVLEASVSASLRLVDAFYVDSDLKLTLMGGMPRSTVFSVQVLRDAENLDFSDDEWKTFLPGIVKSMGDVSERDMRKVVDKDLEKRLSEATGSDTEVKLGKVGKPEVYSAEGDAVRFQVVLPIEASSGDRQLKATLVAAGAVTRVKGKMIYIYLYHQLQDENTAPQLRDQLEALLQRLSAANLPGLKPDLAPVKNTADGSDGRAPASEKAAIQADARATLLKISSSTSAFGLGGGANLAYISPA